MSPGEKLLKRNQVFPVVGTSDTVIIGSNPNRKKLIISAPVPVSALGTPNNQSVDNANTAVLSTPLSYTCPAGKTAIITFAAWAHNTASGQTVQFQAPGGANNAILSSYTVDATFPVGMQIKAGDVVQWRVSVAGAGSTSDFFIGVTEYTAASRVTLSFMGPAVLDQGINLYQGTLPLVLLDDDPGRAFHEEIHAIASAAGTQISVLDLFGP